MPEVIDLRECRITLRHKEFWEDYLRPQFEKRLKLALEELKTTIQRKTREHSSRAEGPSRPGEFTHADTGKLSMSYFWQADLEKLSGTIGSPMPLAYWLEYGLPGWKIIHAKPGSVLSWVDRKSGKRVFAKWVRMGRLEARPNMRRGLLEFEPRCRQIFEARLPEHTGGRLAAG